jgi:hypothetical protein
LVAGYSLVRAKSVGWDVGMTPPGWTPFHRRDDDELLGYLVAGEHGTTPLTVFGFPLAAPSARPDAEEVLRRRGLAVLADSWWLQEEDGSGFRVQILSAYPDRVMVARADFGFVSHDSERRELRVPTGDRLRPFAG